MRNQLTQEQWQALIPELLANFTELMEKHPGSVMDTAWLPFAKADMVEILKCAWTMFPAQRSVVETAWVMLASFQDGVGELPLTVAPPLHVSPAEAERLRQRGLPFFAAAEAEAETRLHEMRRFVETAS